MALFWLGKTQLLCILHEQYFNTSQSDVYQDCWCDFDKLAYLARNLMPLLLTWINLNHSMDTKSHMRSEVWDEIAYAFSNFNLYICRYPQRQFIVLHGTFRANIFEDLLLHGSSCTETFDRMLRGTFRNDHVKNTSSAVAFHCMLRAGPTAQIVLKNFRCAGTTTQKLFIVCCTGIYSESGHFFSAEFVLTVHSGTVEQCFDAT